MPRRRAGSWPRPRDSTVADDPTDSTCSLTTPNAVIEPVTIAAGTTYARFSLFDDFTDGDRDLDLCVFNSANALVGDQRRWDVSRDSQSGQSGGRQLHGRRGTVADGGSGCATFTLFKWLLGSTAAGNMTVTAPATAVTGGTGTINLDFTGLTAGTKYLGSVAYSGVAGLPNPTIVRVDP